MNDLEEPRREIAPREPTEECTPVEGVECLLAATRELSAATDLDEGLRNVADELQRFVQYDTFAVLLLDDLGRELHFASARGFPPSSGCASAIPAPRRTSSPSALQGPSRAEAMSSSRAAC